MSEYFYNMLSAEERARLPYIPTLPLFVEWMEKEFGDLPALSDGDKTLTYKEFCDNIARRRAFIEALGLSKGAKIAVFDRNSRNAIELFFAITSAGYTVIMLPSMLPAPALAGSCRKFDVEALFVRDEFAPLTAGLEGIHICPASSMAETKAPVAVVDKEDPAAIFFTGGTTGSPKGAVISHRAFMRGGHNATYRPGPVIGRDKDIAILPLSHVFGAIACMMGTFYTGGILVTAEDMKATIGKIPVIQPTVLVLVPGLCDILAGLCKMYGAQFLGGKLRMIISGAANVPPRLIQEFDNYGISLFAGYGLTETANLTSANIDVKSNPVSVGHIYPEQETKVVDGELWIKGDNLFSGYYKDEANTKAALTDDGWFRTGDLVRFDEDGYLYIVGRIKNLILLPNGENVSPEAIEEPFYADPCVRDAMAKEDELNGVPCIAIEILPNMQALQGKSEAEIHDYMQALTDRINATLPSTHRIAKMTVRKEDFKRTGSMKVSRI